MGITDTRAASYGGESDGYQNLHRTAALFSAYLGHPISAHDVCALLCLLKLSRSKQDPKHLDNYTDLHGYAELMERLR